MLKGQTLVTVFGVIIFLAGMLGIGGVLLSGFMDVSAELESQSDVLDVVDTTHLIRRCLAGPDGILDSGVLDSLKANADGCGIPYDYVLVTNKETKKEWKAGSRGDTPHAINVPIREDGKIYIGELYVEL
jgi:hypothetical protein